MREPTSVRPREALEQPSGAPAPGAGDQPGNPAIVVVMPVYNDWEGLPELLRRLRQSLATVHEACEIVIADDGSQSEPDVEALEHQIAPPIHAITLLRLTRNLGHQRAIAIGLTYVHNNRQCRTVVVMDSDGEDAPEDVPRLLMASQRANPHIVFARRSKRSEGVTFRVFYQCYLILHRVLTGSWVSFGNFSAIPAALLFRLVSLSELWNHYPAAVIKSRLPIVTVPVARHHRLAGQSRMNLVALIMHGLSAISVAGDVVGVRALLASGVAGFLSALGLSLVVLIRLTTDLAIPGWATYAAGLLVAILLQTISLAIVFVFITLQSRNYATFLPQRDYRDYIADERRLS